MTLIKTRTSIVALFAMVAFAGVALAPAPVANADAGADIVDTAIEAGQFKTLVAAVQAAGLVDTLKGEGPFTVFAPTDEAFAALPEGTLESLLQPENIGTLQAILTYHVVAGAMPAADVVSKNALTTVQGQELTVQAGDGGVRVNQAKVIATDIHTSNGVIHVIDAVVLPPEQG